MTFMIDGVSKTYDIIQDKKKHVNVKHRKRIYVAHKESSSHPDFSANSSYQICNPISSARWLTDEHHEVRALIDAIWIMNLHSPGLKKITHPAGEHSSFSNHC